MIDFDKLMVECKSDDKDELQSYIDNNGLDLAVALVSSKDELILQFSLSEMQGLFDNLTNLFGARERTFENEDDAAIFCWRELEENEIEFPMYTKSLGKKLIKQANKPDPEDNSKPDKLLKSKPTKIKIKAKELIGMAFENTSKSPRKGTTCAILTDFIDTFGSAEYDDLVKVFIDEYKPKDTSKVVDEKLGAIYVREAFINGFIEEGL